MNGFIALVSSELQPSEDGMLKGLNHGKAFPWDQLTGKSVTILLEFIICGREYCSNRLVNLSHVFQALASHFRKKSTSVFIFLEDSSSIQSCQDSSRTLVKCLDVLGTIVVQVLSLIFEICITRITRVDRMESQLQTIHKIRSNRVL